MKSLSSPISSYYSTSGSTLTHGPLRSFGEAPVVTDSYLSVGGNGLPEWKTIDSAQSFTLTAASALN